MRAILKKCMQLMFVSSLLLSVGQAADLMDIYHEAAENDPEFKMAYSAFLSKSEELPQAWSLLLPQLTVNALAGRNRQIVDTSLFRVEQIYNGNAWNINASQAIFNYQAWAQVKSAQASVKAALATFNDAAQKLMLRTATAYFNVLLARDTLTNAEAKKRANSKQLNQATQRYKVGLDPITAVYEAQAAYDQSISQVISANSNLSNQHEFLSQLTNHLYNHLAPLRNNKIPLVKPEPNNADEWVSTGLKQNYNLYVAKYNVEVARENIKAQSAGNWPVFKIQGSTADTHYDSNPSESTVTPKSTVAKDVSAFANNVFVPREQQLSSVNITMNFPIFQGGLVASQTRQAEYNFQTASQQLEKVYRGIVVSSHVAFSTIMDGISKVNADRQTVLSQQKSLDSVSAQYDVGTRTMTDVVNAQRNLFDAEQQLATDQYDLINAILNLKYLSGTLSVEDLEEINTWLETTRVNRPVPR